MREMFVEMRGLVTGGVGFIGSHIVGVLVSNSASAMILDDLSSEKIENVKELCEIVIGDGRRSSVETYITYEKYPYLIPIVIVAVATIIEVVVWAKDKNAREKNTSSVE